MRVRRGAIVCISGYSICSDENAEIDSKFVELAGKDRECCRVDGRLPVLALDDQMIRQEGQPSGVALIVKQDIYLERSCIVDDLLLDNSDTFDLAECLCHHRFQCIPLFCCVSGISCR